MDALLSTSLPGLPPPRRGKVREVYDLGRALLIVATDRLSAFDVVMANGVPGKGKILTQMSNFWFELLGDVCPHHVLVTENASIQKSLPQPAPELNGRSVVVRKAKPLPIECIARGYISGSLYKDYVRFGRELHGLVLPEGLRESDRLPEPVFTPSTKAASGHDESISFQKAVDLVGREIAEKVRDWTLELYRRAREHAMECGLILADTKFEFGETEDGLLWIDEALTPDSSRFWEASQYRPGGPQPSYDKQFVRDYLEEIGWDKQPPGPALPESVIARTREKYVQAFERITGRPFAG
ncbi:MAG: phosphoribosylaminoimidazolesuccinocarboxamide synthase [Fimbriimonadales bacterium]|nr:phosphoribosylaminoimidazolesuccinocarboxamide synthase [Fimbriimonadales bacterium]